MDVSESEIEPVRELPPFRKRCMRKLRLRKFEAPQNGGFVKGGFGECACTPLSRIKVHPPRAFALFRGRITPLPLYQG